MRGLETARIARKLALVACAALAVGYLAATTLLATQQRQYLFNTGDDGRLAAAGGLAVPNSQRVALTASDGVQLSAWYVPPDAGRKVMLFFHGQGGQLVIQTGRWRRIREAGHGVLALSYRGYPGSKGSPTETGINLDARAAYDWLAERHAKQDIILHGHSLGSGVAVYLAAGVEAHALVLEAPFSAAVDVASERMPWLPVGLLMLDQFRSRDRISQVRMPVLIVHGGRDAVIPPAHSERLFSLANEPKVFARVVDGDHNTLVRDGLYDHLWAFLSKIADRSVRNRN